MVISHGEGHLRTQRIERRRDLLQSLRVPANRHQGTGREKVSRIYLRYGEGSAESAVDSPELKEANRNVFLIRMGRGLKIVSDLRG